MKKRFLFLFGSFTAILGCVAACVSRANASTDNKREATAEAIAVESYLYGYPLVTMEMTRRVMTNVARPTVNKAPMGQFANARKYPDASFHDVTAPNADTLYSTAWLDLSKEPYVLHVPNENGRFYLMPMLSGWTDVFASIGTRTTGTQTGNFAITGPNWNGSLPLGLKEYKSPTNLVWILGRTYSSGTDQDYRIVHSLQDRYSLTPLSSFSKLYSPPRGEVNPDIDMDTPVRDQVNNLDASAFFSLLADLMKTNPPAKEDHNMIEKMEKIGLVPGKKFNLDELDESLRGAIEKAPKLAQKKIIENQHPQGEIVNGWVIPLKTGRYGTDYLYRAVAAAIGLGANLPEDAVYPFTNVDSNGASLKGKNRYVIHFPRGKTPPVKGFWSLTMYNTDYFFVKNPINRYSISPRDPLKYNQDGSLDLYVQNTYPGKDKEANWLPAPEGDFILMLRLYWPKESVLQGEWAPPAVVQVE